MLVSARFDKTCCGISVFKVFEIESVKGFIPESSISGLFSLETTWTSPSNYVSSYICYFLCLATIHASIMIPVGVPITAISRKITDTVDKEFFLVTSLHS